ncbi:hypothetical protein L6452_37094 [Arctium lappa]|uniref:Uncharacterized protein n=1 Tax=Arctium lappa TaxID=4217 RepID=A0ACB8Y370_ARCLA|nr:hypothetical protein L6452_37094 [Arctium lappa]
MAEVNSSEADIIPTAAEGKETHEQEVVNDEPGEVTTMIKTPELPIGVETQGSDDAVIHEPEKETEYSVVQSQTTHKSTSCSLLGDPIYMYHEPSCL